MRIAGCFARMRRIREIRSPFGQTVDPAKPTNSAIIKLRPTACSMVSTRLTPYPACSILNIRPDYQGPVIFRPKIRMGAAPACSSRGIIGMSSEKAHNGLSFMT